MTQIKNMINMANKYYDANLVEDKIPLTDPKTWELISSGKTLGVFQFASPVGINVVKKIKPQNMEELSAANAFIRPGASGLEEYVKAKNNVGYSKKIEPRLDKYLEKTYGAIVFQEQIMQLIAELMGVSFGQADIYRRALEKSNKGKNTKIVEEFNQTVVDKAKKLGFSEKVADEVRRLIIENSGYGFNKCLSGNEKIYGYDITIKELYYQYLNYKDGKIKENPLKETISMSVNDDLSFNPINNKIIDIQYSGERYAKKITLNNLKSIIATDNHKFPCIYNNKLCIKEVIDLTTKDKLLIYNNKTNEFDVEGITSIIQQDKEEVYDITMNDPYHNFIIDNGIVTCNSHAVCYSVISYWTAWFKVNYPLIFYTEMLNSCNENEFSLFMQEAKQQKITINPPNINKSQYLSTIEDKENNVIRIGLKSIKGVGPAAVECIEKLQPFNSIDDFFENKASAVNKGVLEALINIGALNNIGIEIEEEDKSFLNDDIIKNNKAYFNKDQLIFIYKKYVELSETKSIPNYAIPIKLIKGKILDSFSLFVEKNTNDIIVPEDKLELLEIKLSNEQKSLYKTRRKPKGLFKLSSNEDLKNMSIFRKIIRLYGDEILNIKEDYLNNYISEMEILGYSFIEHPCNKYIKKIYNQNDNKSTFNDMADNSMFMSCGIISGLEEKLTKNNKKYYLLTIITPVDTIKLQLWNNQYEQYKNIIKKNVLIKVLGTKGFNRMQVIKMEVIKSKKL